VRHSSLDSMIESPRIINSAPSFFMSFADLMMIVTVFFVLLLSVSSIQKGNFDRMRASFSGSTKGTMVDLANRLRELAQPTKDVSIYVSDEGIRMDMESAALFNTGEAYLKEGSLDSLSRVFREILSSSYNVDVEGHTDDVGFYRLDGREVLTNWSLSGRRASSVVLYLLEFGFTEERLRIVGYAATKPRADVKGRFGPELDRARAMNRRVTILVR
jgi:chemotaxis protein MotB